MGQVLHGSATTTEAVRRAIQASQESQESLSVLARRYGINKKTVAKWKRRESFCDLPTGPKQPHSTLLSLDEEATIVAFRRHTLLPLDDCLYTLRCSRPSRTPHGLHCTGVFSATGSAACLKLKATSRSKSGSRPIRSDTFT